MEDTRGLSRAKNFMKIPVGDPKKQREEFLVSLRKKRKSEMFKQKRRVLQATNIDITDLSVVEIIPEFFRLHVVERAEALLQKFCRSSTDTETLHLLKIMTKIVNEQWRADYDNIFLSSSAIKTYNTALNSSEAEIRRLSLQILTNLFYEVNTIYADREEEIVSSGMFLTILQNLCFKAQTTPFELEMCENSFVCLANMGVVSKSLKEHLISNKIFTTLADIFLNHELINNDSFVQKFIHLLEVLIRHIKKADDTDLQALVPVINHTILNWWDNDTLIKSLKWLHYMYSLSQEFWNNSEVVFQLTKQLKNSDIEVKISALGCIERISGFESLKFDWLLDTAPDLQRVLLNSKVKVKEIVLVVISNLILSFEEALDKILNDTSILYKIFAELNTTNWKLQARLLETLNVFVEKANFEQLESIVEQGLFYYVTDRVSTSSYYTEVLEEYLLLIYNVLDKEKRYNPDGGIFIEEFR